MLTSTCLNFLGIRPTSTGAPLKVFCWTVLEIKSLAPEFRVGSALIMWGADVLAIYLDSEIKVKQGLFKDTYMELCILSYLSQTVLEYISWSYTGSNLFFFVVPCKLVVSTVNCQQRWHRLPASLFHAVLVSFLLLWQNLRKTKKERFIWLIVSDISVHDQLASLFWAWRKAEHPGRRAQWRKIAYPHGSQEPEREWEEAAGGKIIAFQGVPPLTHFLQLGPSPVLITSQ